MASVSFTCMCIAECQGIAQHLVQRYTLVGEQGVACRNRHHQWIVPNGFGNKSVTSLIQLSKPYVVEIVVQPLDLLAQGYLGQANLDFRLFLSAKCQES
ncbi:hypothetical protein MASR1M60_32250 [Rhodocyclaceae bacterium]